jgi:quinone-modifying oxidoreductase subunit QmoC
MKKVEMEEWADPSLLKEVRRYGRFDTNACLNCGGCTITCALASNATPFSPRSSIQYVRTGLKRRLLSSLDPWLCYYCGDCSTSCPRQADPGETMMTLRRFLTANYDWTGIAKKLYTSKVWEFSAILLLAGVVFLLWALLPGLGLPTTSEGMSFNDLAPAEIVHSVDVVVAILLAGFLLSFVFNMYLKTIKSDKSLKVPPRLYITELGNMVFHFLFQWRFSECEDNSKGFFKRILEGKYNYWITHFLLMSGYALLFLMIVFFLPWFQGKDETYHWWNIQRILGFYGTIVLIFGTVYFLIRRIRKNNEKSKFSHTTDWTFVILLLLTTLTGIAIFFCRINNLPLFGFYTYLVHLMVAIPMLMIEVPFSKWSHLAYRPVAIYLNRIKEKALRIQEQKLNKISTTEAE